MVSSLVSHPPFRLSAQYQTVQTRVNSRYNSKVSSWERRLIWSRGTRKHCKLCAGSRRARFSCQYQVWQRATQRQLLTALFKNTRILRFKSQLTFEFFAAVNHLSGPLRKQNFSLTGSKGHGLWLVDFDSFFVFQGLLLAIVKIWLKAVKNSILKAAFWILEFAYFWKVQ